MTMVAAITAYPYEVVRGTDDRCDHVGSQIIRYSSPGWGHTVWSCPRCHRIVRQDWERPDQHGWTAPEIVIPKGLEGVAAHGRAWRMPERLGPVPARTKRGWRW